MIKILLRIATTDLIRKTIFQSIFALLCEVKYQECSRYVDHKNNHKS